VHGEKARAFFAKMPELTPYEASFYRSFWEVGTERSFGMAPGPIPRSAIVQYCEDEGIWDPSDRIIFMRYIRAMDSAYLNALAKQRDKENSTKS